MLGKIKTFLFGGLLIAITGCSVHATEPGQVGVKVNLLTGLDPDIYAPGGTYFFPPLITDFYTFSTQTQTLTMLADPTAGDREGKDDLEFKTRDGNDVGVDVTILYRIEPALAPYILTSVARDDASLKEHIVRPMARSMVRDVLNELSSEDIYSGKKFEAADRARLALDEALSQYGVRCDNVILGDHRFHERYQSAINDRKVYDQKVNTTRSAAENVVREYEAKLESSRGQVEQTIAAENGLARQSMLSSDAYYVARQKEAEAILAEKTAKAEGVRKMNEALAGAGGRVMVKRKIAENLKGKRIVVLPGGAGDMGVQKLDVNALIQMYAATSALDTSK